MCDRCNPEITFWPDEPNPMPKEGERVLLHIDGRAYPMIACYDRDGDLTLLRAESMN